MYYTPTTLFPKNVLPWLPHRMTMFMRPACMALVLLLCAARTSDTNDVLMGMIVTDAASGDELTFELRQRDAPQAAAVADSFCARMHTDSRVDCQRTLKAHLLARGYLTEPELEETTQSNQGLRADSGHLGLDLLAAGSLPTRRPDVEKLELATHILPHPGGPISSQHGDTSGHRLASNDNLLKVPDDFKTQIHFHVFTSRPRVTSKTCGGCRVLWALYDVLQKKGYSATAASRCPKPSEYAEKLVVIIMPEVLNVLTCRIKNEVIVRWMLAVAGQFNTGLNWWKDDIVMYYGPWTGINVDHTNVLQVLENPEKGDKLDISVAEFNKPRTKDIAWMMHKGRIWNGNDIEYIHNQPGLVSQEFLPAHENQLELSEFKYFVTYDPYTYWSFIAAMQGTVSVLYPYKFMPRRIDWELSAFGGYLLAKGNTDKDKGPLIPGFAYGWTPAELDHAKSTMHQTREFLSKVKEWGETTVHRFARDAYRRR